MVAAIAATVAVAVWMQWRQTQIAPGEAAPTAVELAVPAHRDGPVPDVAAALAAFDADERLGDWVGQVSDVATGQVVYSRHSEEPLRPASITKLVTGLAAVHTLPLDARVSTEVYRDPADASTVYLRGNGDVWIDADALDELAQIITAPASGSDSAVSGAASGSGLAAAAPVARILVDNSAWEAFPAWQPSWNPDDVAGGFIAPMEPLMMDVSPTPSLDVARAVADRVAGAQGTDPASIAVDYGAVPGALRSSADADSGRADADSGRANAAAASGFVGEHLSDTLLDRLTQTLEFSNNIGAEALAREVALATASEFAGESPADSADPADYPAALVRTVAPLVAADSSQLVLRDASGMSADNRLTPAFVDGILQAAAHDTKLSPLLAALPVAGGWGTLDERMEGTPAQGWVRAKTGTLDGTSGLAGTVMGVDGSVFTFAFISNGSNVLEARAALDEMAAVLRGL